MAGQKISQIVLTRPRGFRYKGVPSSLSANVLQTPSHEKEIHFPISILQTPAPDRRFVLFRGHHAGFVCAATHSLRPIRQSTARCARPISWRDAGGEVRHLAASAQHEAAALERMYEAR